MTHLSASQVGSFLACPRQHKYRYIDHVPEPRRAAALAFGSAIHAGLAAWYHGVREGLEHNDLLDPCLRAYQDSWADSLCAGVDLGDKDDPDEMTAKGVDMLHAFEAKAQRPDEVLSVEERFEVDLADDDTGEVVSLVGYMDAVVRYGDTLAILEHKTGARKWSEEQVRQNLQCTLYSMAAGELGYGGAEVHVQMLTKTKTPAFEVYRAERTSRDKREAMQVLTGVQRAAEAGVSYPVRGWMCKGCAYRDICEGEGK